MSLPSILVQVAIFQGTLIQPEKDLMYFFKPKLVIRKHKSWFSDFSIKGTQRCSMQKMCPGQQSITLPHHLSYLTSLIVSQHAGCCGSHSSLNQQQQETFTPFFGHQVHIQSAKKTQQKNPKIQTPAEFGSKEGDQFSPLRAANSTAALQNCDCQTALCSMTHIAHTSNKSQRGRLRGRQADRQQAAEAPWGEEPPSLMSFWHFFP